MPEQRAAVDINLAVQRDNVACLVRDQWIDLDEAGIQINIQLVELLDETAELAHLLLVQLKAKSQLPCLVALQSCIRGDGDRENPLRRFCGNLFDVHAARS